MEETKLYTGDAVLSQSTKNKMDGEKRTHESFLTEFEMQSELVREISKRKLKYVGHELRQSKTINLIAGPLGKDRRTEKTGTTISVLSFQLKEHHNDEHT